MQKNMLYTEILRLQGIIDGNGGCVDGLIIQ